MQCCEKSVHISCLLNWHEKNLSNHCFMCKQENSFCKELTNDNSNIELSSRSSNTNSIVIFDDSSSINDSEINNNINNNINNINNINNNINNNNRNNYPNIWEGINQQRRKKCKKDCIICSITSVVIIVLLVVFL